MTDLGGADPAETCTEHLDALLSALVHHLDESTDESADESAEADPGGRTRAVLTAALTATSTDANLTATRTALLASPAITYAQARDLVIPLLEPAAGADVPAADPDAAGPAGADPDAAGPAGADPEPEHDPWRNLSLPLDDGPTSALVELLLRPDAPPADVICWVNRDVDYFARAMADELTAPATLEALTHLLAGPTGPTGQFHNLARIAANPNTPPATAVSALQHALADVVRRGRARTSAGSSTSYRVIAHNLVMSLDSYAQMRLRPVLAAWLDAEDGKPVPTLLLAMIGAVGFPDGKLAQLLLTLDQHGTQAATRTATDSGTPLELLTDELSFLARRVVTAADIMSAEERATLLAAVRRTSLTYGREPLALILDPEAVPASLDWVGELDPPTTVHARALALLEHVGPDPHVWELLTRLAAQAPASSTPHDLLTAVRALEPGPAPDRP